MAATWLASVNAAALLPILSLTTVVGSQVVSGVVPLAAQADALGISSVQFQVSGQNVGPMITAGTCSTSWDTRTVTNGLHTVTAVGTDSNGSSIWTLPVVVQVQNAAQADTTAPTVGVSAPSAGAVVTGTATLAASASDNVAVASVWFTVDGTTVGSEDATAPYQLSWTSTTVSNGTHSVRAVARDTAGNIATSAPVTVTVNNASGDTTAPTVSLTAPSAGASVNGIVTVSASASDNVGIANVQFTIDGVDMGAADTTAPYAISWSTNGNGDGPRVVRAVARDTAGNTALSAPITVTVNNTTADTTGPIVSMAAPSAGASVSGTVTISATASDNVGVTNVQFRLDGANLGVADTTSPYSVAWTTAGVPNGTHVLSAVARDAAGNSTTSAGITVTVANQSSDTTAPTVSVSSPSSGATVSGTVTVSASASDNVGVTSVQFTIDDVNVGPADTTSPFSTSWNTTSATNGSHVLRAVARDAAGNTTTSGARTVTVSNSGSDTTAPSVSLTAPASWATVSGNVTVSATASDNVGVVSVQFTVDGVNLGAADTTAPWSTVWDTRTATNGSHVLRAVARDAAGNTRTSSSRTVPVNNASPDMMAPTITLTAPASGATVGGIVAMAATASDNVGVVGVQFMLNGANVGGEDMAAPYSISWPTLGVPDGPYQITAIARDAAGNRRTSAAITVAVSNQQGSGVEGDLNGDGSPDLLFAHSTGQLHAWFMNGGRMVGDAALVPANTPEGWVVVTVNDFNGDQKSDVLLQNRQTGRVTLWAMDGVTRIGEAAILESDTPWRIIGSGDFNDDGQTDLVWQLPSTGELFVWLMDGPNMLSGAQVSPTRVDTRWRLAGTGDMNEDGRPDLVWQNDTTGEMVAWLLNGLAMIESRRLTPGAVSFGWRIRAVGDFDGDGHADVVWQQTSSGFLYIWYMDGTRLARSEFLSPARVAASWQIVGGQ